MSDSSSESKGKRLEAEPVQPPVDSTESSVDRSAPGRSAEDKPSETVNPAGARDPLSIGQESHRASVGASAVVGGAAVGALGGVVAGPAGAAVGSVLGAMAAGLGAQTLSEAIDPSVEVAFWADECRRRDYFDPQVGPEPFLEAYRIGWENHDPKVAFDERESELKSRWEATESAKRMTWLQARSAMHDAWQRVASQYYPNDMQNYPNDMQNDMQHPNNIQSQ